MNRKLRATGIIIASIALVINIYLLVVAYTTPNYNYAVTPKPPSWLSPASLILGLAGILLFNLGNRQKKPTLPNFQTENPLKKEDETNP
jgi:hypothetical protein